MAQPIPPLLCNTPPPIDSDDGNDDDFGDFEGARTDYEGSLSASPRHEVKNVEENLELPPLPNDVEYSLYTNTNPSPIFEPAASLDTSIPGNDDNDDDEIVPNPASEQKEKNLNEKYTSDADLESELNVIKLTESEVNSSDTINRSELKTEHLEKSSREDSPQSLELYTTNLSEEEDDSIGEFQVAGEAKYDDNTSLPSLKFDSIIVSKSTTPIFDEKTNKSKEQEDTIESNNSILSALPSLTSSQTILQNKFESNASETTSDQLGVSQEKLEELFTDFQQHFSEEGSESDATIVVRTSCTKDEIVTNDKGNYTTIGELNMCGFEDFTLDKDVLVENEDSIFKVENDLAKNLSSTEDNIVDNFTNFTFEADFSQFEAVDDKKSVSEYDKVHIIGKPIVLPESIENEKDVVDDDDFEDFQDFTTGKVHSTADNDFSELNEFDITYQDSIRRGSFKLMNVDGKVKPIINLMFPVNVENDDSCSNLKDSIQENSESFNSQLTINLKEIDTAKALDYQWTNSNVKQSLIKSLGIDSRNILYGEKWNSSVPRFASNLVFNPLEPLKPTKVGGHKSCSPGIQENRHENSAGLKGNVPEVEFDWNSSGLVNPLDGVKEVLCKRKAKAIHSAQFGSVNESIEQQVTEKATTQINPSNTAANLSSIDNDITNEPFTIQQDFNNGEEHPTAHQIIKSGSDEPHSSSTASTAFVFPLKETHIFTPSKLDSVPRHIKNEDRDPIDFDYKTAAAGIIIDEKVVKKEYRDVEYNPTNWNFGPLEEKYISGSSGLNTCTSSNFDTPVDILGGNFPPSLAEKSDDVNFSENFSTFQFNSTKSNSHFKEKEFVKKSCETSGDNFEPIMKINEELPVGKNDGGLDDDFTEFQSVPPPCINPVKINNQKLKPTVDEKSKSRTGTPTLSDEMILSPAVLLPQAIKIESGLKIDWPEPGINPEELARIEELFPQSKNESKQTTVKESQLSTATSAHDDDDWSDFVSVPVTNQSSMSQMQKPAGDSSPSVKTITSQPIDDEWSDFVSSAPVQWNTTSLLPQYHAWNHQTAKPAINSYISQPSIQFQHKNNVPINFYQGNNINNNISQYLLHSNSVIADHRPNHFLPPQQEQILQNNTVQYQNHQFQPDQNAFTSQLNQTPSISLIPDLGFVAPRNLINIPRSALSKK